MKAQLEELIAKISSGCLPEDEIARIADEAAQAYADPAAFLAANPDVNYDDEFPIPLGEWVVVGSLPETVLFQADSYEELFQRITESFGPQVQFVLKAKQLAKTEPLKALNRIQVQLSALSPETGGYVLVDFSEPLDDELQAVLEMGRRHLAERLRRDSALESPQAVRDYLKARLRHEPHELFGCLFLDAKHRVLAFEVLFHGTIDGASVYPRQVVKRALAQNAAAVILTHNHPSGVAEPSQADRQLTQRLKDALALIDVRVLDHFIVGDGEPLSMAELGWM